MTDNQSTNTVDGQKSKSVSADPPPSYDEVVNAQPSAYLNSTSEISSNNDVLPKPSAPMMVPDPYNDGFNNVGQQCITNVPYNTTTSTIPVYNVIQDEEITNVRRKRHLEEDDDGCCSCGDVCVGCLACMTACRCVLDCCNLIILILSACAKN